MKPLRNIITEDISGNIASLKPRNVITGLQNHPRLIDPPKNPVSESTYAHYHNLPEFCICLSGKAVLQVEADHYLLEPGDICLVGRNIHHFEHYVNTRTPYEMLWVIFHSVTECLLVHCRYKNRVHGSVQSIHLDVPAALVEQLDTLTELKDPVRQTGAVKKMLTVLAGAVASPPGAFTEYYFADRRRSNFQVRRIMQAQEYIADHYAEKLTLKDIARQVDLNPEYFDRLFSKVTRRTVVEFINSTRLQMAQKFMNETNLSLAEISYRVGYNDPYYFSRVFRKFFGLSPKKFRDRYTRLN